jgi:hypothetical protein
VVQGVYGLFVGVLEDAASAPFAEDGLTGLRGELPERAGHGLIRREREGGPEVLQDGVPGHSEWE